MNIQDWTERRLREAVLTRLRGLSNRDAADRLGVSEATIRRWLGPVEEIPNMSKKMRRKMERFILGSAAPDQMSYEEGYRAALAQVEQLVREMAATAPGKVDGSLEASLDAREIAGQTVPKASGGE